MLDQFVLKSPLTPEEESQELSRLMRETAEREWSSRCAPPLISARRNAHHGISSHLITLRGNGFDVGSHANVISAVARLGIDPALAYVSRAEFCIDLAEQVTILQNGLTLERSRTHRTWSTEPAGLTDIVTDSLLAHGRRVVTFYQGSMKGPQLKIYDLAEDRRNEALAGVTRVEVVVRPQWKSNVRKQGKVALPDLQQWLLQAGVFSRVRWQPPMLAHCGAFSEKDIFALGVHEAARLRKEPTAMALGDPTLWESHKWAKSLFKREKLASPPFESCLRQSVERYFKKLDDTPLSSLVFDLDGTVVREIPHGVIRPARGPIRSAINKI